MSELTKLTLKQFKSREVPDEVDTLLSMFNGGSFMECHQAIREATGIWIPELVPVFQKLDSMLAIRELPPELRQ